MHFSAIVNTLIQFTNNILKGFLLITVEKLATASWDLLPIQYLEDYDVTILSFSWNLDVTSRSVTQNKNKESKFSLLNIKKFVSALLDLSWNRLSRIEPNL